jgi:hypothetical protein
MLLAPAWNIPAAMWSDEDKAVRAFRTGEGVPWGDHADRLFSGMGAFYKNAYGAQLVPEWLPALEGVVGRLEAGARVADVGCGHGHSTVQAEAFPTHGSTGSTRTPPRSRPRGRTRKRRASRTGSSSRSRRRPTTRIWPTT